MKTIVSKIVISAFAIFLLIQFYQPVRNIDSVKVSGAHFIKVYTPPTEVKNILQRSCYDCHSNNTNYPWYSYVQPVRMFLDSDINRGKKELNFSEFGNYSKRKQLTKLDRIIKEIKSNKMPLSSYTFIHKDATLSENQKKEILDWLNKTKDSISI